MNNMNSEKLLHVRKRLEESKLNKSLVDLIMFHSGEVSFVESTGEEYIEYRKLHTDKTIHSRVIQLTRELADPYSRKALSDPASQSIMRKILLFLASERKESVSEISELIKDVPWEEYSYLHYQMSPDFADFLYDGYTDDSNSYQNKLAFDKDVSRSLLYGLLNMSTSKLGFKTTFELLNETVHLYNQGRFNGDKNPLKIFVGAILYFEENSDFPTEWLISGAFNKHSLGLKGSDIFSKSGNYETPTATTTFGV